MQIDSINQLPPKYQKQAAEKLGINKENRQNQLPLPRKQAEISIQGKPIAKGRPRLGKGGHTYTPEKTQAAEKVIADTWKLKYGDKKLSGALRITVCAAFLVPKSKSKKEKEQLLARAYRTERPDIDNIVKLVLDALNKVAYEDDSCIAEIRASKIFDNMEYTYVQIEQL